MLLLWTMTGFGHLLQPETMLMSMVHVTVENYVNTHGLCYMLVSVAHIATEDHDEIHGAF